MSAYSASKLAAIRVLDMFGAENRDIHVLNLHPGLIDTDIERRNPLDAFLPHDDGMAVPQLFAMLF
jgi:NAD(P)-dependent dehydrogenase (short-subunit alcohol dehydrogenase family)